MNENIKGNCQNSEIDDFQYYFLLNAKWSKYVTQRKNKENGGNNP
jgi:hypothetical protein